MVRRLLAQPPACLTFLTNWISNDPVRLLSGGGDADVAGSTGGAHGAAVRELQMQWMHHHPDEYVGAVRVFLARELGLDPSRPPDVTAFLREFGGLERCREVAQLLATNRPLAAQEMLREFRGFEQCHEVASVRQMFCHVRHLLATN